VRTGTIQDKIANWAAHQPVKIEPTVDFPTLQEDMSCRDLADSIMLGTQG
jgi:hypothetical protein